MKQALFLAIPFIFLPYLMTGQCYPDRHSTNWFDGWVSCESSPNPNVDRGDSHWILYDFGKVYELGETHIWNTNDPKHLDWGMQDVVIDYSTDGETWTEAGIYTISQGSGKSIYEGSQGPDLNGVTAQFLLITALTNWGGTCFGLSELQIEAEEVTTALMDLPENACFQVSVFPNPFSERSRIEIRTSCQDDLSYMIVDVLGHVIKRSIIDEIRDVHTIILDSEDFAPGTYFVNVRQGNMTERFSVVKVSLE